MYETLDEIEQKYKLSSGKKKERFKEVIDRCYEVKDNLNVYELELIWYIQHLNGYRLLNFLLLAHKMYDAERLLYEMNDYVVKASIDKK